jgi:hypothetical protein
MGQPRNSGWKGKPPKGTDNAMILLPGEWEFIEESRHLSGVERGKGELSEHEVSAKWVAWEEI